MTELDVCLEFACTCCRRPVELVVRCEGPVLTLTSKVLANATIDCPNCGEVAVPDDQLPVLLPEDADFQLGGDSPLARHPTWKHVTCPSCGGEAVLCASLLKRVSPPVEREPSPSSDASFSLSYRTCLLICEAFAATKLPTPL